MAKKILKKELLKLIEKKFSDLTDKEVVECLIELACSITREGYPGSPEIFILGQIVKYFECTDYIDKNI